MKPIRVNQDEQRGPLALDWTDDARQYARETEREAVRWARARRRRSIRRDRAAFRFLAFLREGGAR